jgi:hypothetical protein
MPVSQSLRRYALLPLVVLAAMMLAMWTRQAPFPSARSGFSLAKAQEIVADISRAPHPAASAENARVRQSLVTRLQALGLTVETQRDVGVRQADKRKGAISVAPLENVIAVLPGRDRNKPAVALMAHFDSADWSYGAADDGAGVAAVLETARLLKAGPQPARDVIFLITDAEEVGMLGAQSFFDQHRFASRDNGRPGIGVVVNVEARGSRGRAFMFQTSPGNAALVDLWANNAVFPSGNSLATDVYEQMPNDTDLSVPLSKGIMGINAAFVDGFADYHMPTDTAANLEPAALQHLGDFAVTTTRALAMAEALPLQAKDSAYFDVLGQGVARYPLGWGWGLIGLAVGILGFSRFWRLGISWQQTLGGTIGAALLTAGVGGLCHFLARGLYGAGTLAMRERVAEMEYAFWIYILLMAGMILFLRPRPALWIGATIMTILCATAAQIWLPGANWLFAWPALMGAVLIALAVRYGLESRVVLGTSFILGASLGTMLLQGVILTYVSVEPITSAPVALIVPFTLMLIGPLMLPYGAVNWGRWLGAGLLGLAAFGALVLGLSSGFSKRLPRPGDLFHLTDATTNKSWWVSSSSSHNLPSGKVDRIKPVWYGLTRWYRVPTKASLVAKPGMTLVRYGNRATLSLTTPDAPRELVFRLKPSHDLCNVTVNGKPVSLPSDAFTRLAWRAETAADLKVEFDACNKGRIDLEYLYARPGLPEGAPEAGGPNTDWATLSGSTVTTGKHSVSW